MEPKGIEALDENATKVENSGWDAQEEKKRKAESVQKAKKSKASLSGKKREVDEVSVDYEIDEEEDSIDEMIKRVEKQIEDDDFDDDEEEVQRKPTVYSQIKKAARIMDAPTKTKAEVTKFLEDVKAVPLGRVPIFDDCDEIRRKLTQLFQRENIPLARYAAAIGVTSLPVNRFLSKKGIFEGGGSRVYQESYYFFEKLRLLRNEPKSPHRLLSEKRFPNGYPLKNAPRYTYVIRHRSYF